ncbi:MAG TPA: fused MFS/spermidine synthase, partial [Gaiellaceae bacterium]|nr:fused MFS/spermidine synthase [Gaiellaceae bacterium]
MSRDREGRSALAIGVAVFLSGGVLLGLEIVASRVLAPFFGNSLFVWGALIGVVLAGLSLGYWVGGALADRFPTAYLLIGSI